MKRIFITRASSGIALGIAAHKNGHNAPDKREGTKVLWRIPLVVLLGWCDGITCKSIHSASSNRPLSGY